MAAIVGQFLIAQAGANLPPPARLGHAMIRPRQADEVLMQLNVTPEDQKDAGVGTVVALMLPYFLVLIVVWTIFLAGWPLLGLPWGF